MPRPGPQMGRALGAGSRALAGLDREGFADSGTPSTRAGGGLEPIGCGPQRELLTEVAPSLRVLHGGRRPSSKRGSGAGRGFDLGSRRDGLSGPVREGRVCVTATGSVCVGRGAGGGRLCVPPGLELTRQDRDGPQNSTQRREATHTSHGARLSARNIQHWQIQRQKAGQWVPGLWGAGLNGGCLPAGLRFHFGGKKMLQIRSQL